MSRQMEIDFTQGTTGDVSVQAPMQDLLSASATNASVDTMDVKRVNRPEIVAKTADKDDHKRVPFAALKASAHKVSNALFGR